MDFVIPYDQIGVSPPGPWTNASPAAGQKGSIVNAEVFPAVQTEILSVIDAAGITRDANNLTQLLAGIRKLISNVVPPASLWHVGTDTSGSAASITAPVTPAVTTRTPDLAYLIFPAHACAGTTTIDVGFGPEPLTRQDASALLIGDYAAGQPLVVVDDGANFRITGLTPPQNALWHTGTDTSTSAAAITAPATPAVTTRVSKLAYLIFPAHACAGATTLDVGFGPISLARQDASALQPDDYQAGQPLIVIDDGTVFRIVDLTLSQVAALIGTQTITIISQPLTLYVATTGSDSNDGSTPSTALATINAALAKVSRYNLNGYAATINVGAGTFAGFSAKIPFAGRVSITGTSGATTISDTVAQCVLAQYEAELTLSNLILTSSVGSCLLAQFGGRIVLNAGMVFGSAAQNHMTALNFGEIDIDAPYTITGGAQAHIEALYHAAVTKEVEVAFAVTLTGTPSFSVAFAYTDNLGLIHFLNGSFSGSATGIRFNSGNSSLINTGGSGVNFFPGSSPGTISSNGGQYI